MQTTFDLDGSKWAAQVLICNRRLGLEAREGLTEQSRLLLKQIIALTPPNNRAQGRTRTGADISKVVKSFNVDSFRDKRLEEIVNRQDHRAFEAYMRHVDNDAIRNARSGPFSESLHQRARDKRGRVRAQDRKFFVIGRSDRSRLAAYVKKKLANVGLAKSGWVTAAWSIGLPIPGWMSGHIQRGQSDVINRLDHPDDPTFTAINSAPWAENRAEGERVVGYAIRYRIKAMEKALARALERAAHEAGIDIRVA
jgi:hypothetical protein